MRYGWLLLLLLLVLPALAVEYGNGTAIKMTANVSATKVGPGEVVHLTISGGDADYEMGPNLSIRRTLDDPVALAWEATGGSFVKLNVGNNPAELAWHAPLAPGFYTILLTADDSGKYADDPPVRYMVEIVVARAGQPPTPSVRVSANPPVIKLDRQRTATITAQLLGDKNLGGQTIRFYATRGTLSSTQVVTDNQGMATVRLTAGPDDIGTAVIAAAFGNTSATTTIDIFDTTPPPYPDPTPGPYTSDFGVGVDPPSIPADGQSTAIVTVRFTDLRGYGLTRQPVSFRITMGLITPVQTVTDYYGYARARVYAPSAPGQGTIIAESGGKRGYAIITFTGTQQPAPQTGPLRLFLTVDPTTLLADGTSKIRVEALVLGPDGKAVPDTNVTFGASLGTLQQTQATTDTGGKATATLIASNRPGLATVTARVGQISAASQVNFQGVPTGGPGLDLRLWRGQQTTYINERWLVRTMQVENGPQGGFSKSLIITDDTAKVVREIPLGRNAILIRDQYGATRGYGIEEDGKARIVILRPDGADLRAGTMPLTAGSHLLDAQYAEPAGNVLIASAKPDGTSPEVQFLSKELTPVRTLRDGLEAMPVMTLGGDGFLVMALPGGTTRLYEPDGQPVSEGRRTDGLPATTVALAAGGEWYAVATGQAGQATAKPKLRIYSRQGTELIAFDIDALRILPINGNALFAATTDRSVYLSIPDRRSLWTLVGGYERALATETLLIIAGLQDPKDNDVLIPRIFVIRQNDGTVLASQNLKDIDAVHAVLPADDKGMIGVVTVQYTFRFPLPKE